MKPRLNPRRIPNHGRFQTDIEAEQNAAAQFVALLEEKKIEATRDDYLNLALIAVEGGKWADADKYTKIAESWPKSEEEKDMDADSLGLIHYVRATACREQNRLAESKKEFDLFLNTQISPWLKSNALRNKGLVFVKEGNWEMAAELFNEAYQYTLAQSKEDKELEGCLPALHNYWALACCRAALQCKTEDWKEKLEAGLQAFTETTAMYQGYFQSQGIAIEERGYLSNDYLSHLTHRGMVQAEFLENTDLEPDEDKRQESFNQVRLVLLDVYNGRQRLYKGNEKSVSNAQRLGDSALWVGRACQGMGNTREALKYYAEASAHYRTAFPPAPQMDKLRSGISSLLASESTRALLNILKKYEQSKWYKSVDRVRNAKDFSEYLNNDDEKNEESLLEFIQLARIQAEVFDQETSTKWWRIFKPRHAMSSRFLSTLDEAEVAVNNIYRPLRG